MTLAGLDWCSYCDEIARILGAEHIDGDDSVEGYSIDAAHDSFVDGWTADEAATEFRAIYADIMGGDADIDGERQIRGALE